MASESENDLHLEIGHVLFIDLVGYSKLLLDEQKKRLRQLTEIVLSIPQVEKATNEQLVRLPAGGGMALVFRKSFVIYALAKRDPVAAANQKSAAL
jgi:hypothetical protein